MVNRILLNSSGLKISNPGVDVITAQPASLLFSSDWSALTVAQQGTYILNSWSGGANSAEHTGFIPFNRTYPSPPMVLVYLVRGGSHIPISNGRGAYFGGARSAGSFQYDSYAVSWTAGTTGIGVRAYYYKEHTPSLSRPDMVLKYFILDFAID